MFNKIRNRIVPVGTAKQIVKLAPDELAMSIHEDEQKATVYFKPTSKKK